MIAVLGRGLFGSAAARHLAKAGHKVALIGPDEPAERRTHRGVFGSHYDEGRITRHNALNPFWVGVSKAAIARYSEIKQESGISFFSETGAMIAGPASYVDRARAAAAPHDVVSEDLDIEGLRATFPYFSFPDGFEALYERAAAGHISPRNLVAAQCKAAQAHGAKIVAETVTGFKERPDHIQIVTEHQTIRADQVLVAAGAMSDMLLGRPPVLEVYQRTVAFFEVGPDEVARLSKMPSLVYDSADGCYLLPPIRYLDGKTYIKLGGDPVDVELHGERAIGDWFRAGGSPEIRDRLEGIMRALMPDLDIRSVSMDACVTTWTKDRLPEIRRLSDRVAICSGGNGAGAKCSDELGRLGAEILVKGRDR